MDDSFFELFFSKDKKYIEFVIREIFQEIDKPLVKVESVFTQYNMKTLGGCNPRLDLLAIDEEGNKINIEVQRTVGPDMKFRSRFYCAVIDANSLPKGAEYKDLPETYVIFITEKDIRDQGLPVYVTERVFLNDKKPVEDGCTIVYVNGEYRGDDRIGRLMNDFSAIKAENMQNSVLAEGMRFFKETEAGRKELSGLDARIFSEGRQEGREEGREEEREKIILSMLNNDLSFSIISKCSGYPVKKIKELRARFIEEGLLPA